jgi:hypothetical protein
MNTNPELFFGKEHKIYGFRIQLSVWMKQVLRTQQMLRFNCIYASVYSVVIWSYFFYIHKCNKTFYLKNYFLYTVLLVKSLHKRCVSAYWGGREVGGGTCELLNSLDMCFCVHFRIVLSDTPTNAQVIFIIWELAYMFRP